jgi:DNA topoisomerase IA
LPSLQKLCGSLFGWPASKTLEVAQELYDGQGKKIITYPRAEVRYLPQSLISDVPRIVAGLQMGQSFSAIPVPDPPVIRKGASGTFSDKGLDGASHHAIIPNVNTVENLREVWPRLSSDEQKFFDVIARAYLAALMPDFRYRQTTATLDVRGEFRASGRQPIDLGWSAPMPLRRFPPIQSPSPHPKTQSLDRRGADGDRRLSPIAPAQIVRRRWTARRSDWRDCLRRDVGRVERRPSPLMTHPSS